jgi:hypothetical protein
MRKLIVSVAVALVLVVTATWVYYETHDEKIHDCPPEPATCI